MSRFVVDDKRSVIYNADAIDRIYLLCNEDGYHIAADLRNGKMVSLGKYEKQRAKEVFDDIIKNKFADDFYLMPQ